MLLDNIVDGLVYIRASHALYARQPCTPTRCEGRVGAIAHVGFGVKRVVPAAHRKGSSSSHTTLDA